MKSIKEMAEEYSSGYMNLDRQQVAKQALEYGTNYVLEQLEEFLNLCGNYCITSSAKAYLEDIIEQLKK